MIGKKISGDQTPFGDRCSSKLRHKVEVLEPPFYPTFTDPENLLKIG